MLDVATAQLFEADAAGFCSVDLTEHHFGGYNTYTDPFMFGAWLASQLTQAYVGITVMRAPYHHPLRMVESCNILDQLTRGRCIIGLTPAPCSISVSMSCSTPGPGQRATSPCRSAPTGTMAH